MASTESPVVIDMRSDVLTKPTAAMRQAMADATFDDDIYREDQTVLELERKVAEMFGMDAALFVPSGTMGNLIGVSCHCPSRGVEVIIGDKSHVYLYEQAGIAQFSGLQPRSVPTLPDGTFDLDLLEEYIRPTTDPHEPFTGLVVVENTHNYMGGKVIPIQFMEKLREKLRPYGIPIHMDGARVLNAAVALGVPPRDVVKDVDSVSFCFSKGVGAPIGSVIMGSHQLIARAVRMRKALGGGWRKPGPLAAAALVALQDAPERLRLDHEHAQLFATEINAKGEGVVRVDVGGVHTNIIMVEVVRKNLTAVDFCKRLAEVNDAESLKLAEQTSLVAGELSKTVVRFVISCNHSIDDVQRAIKKITYVIRELATK